MHGTGKWGKGKLVMLELWSLVFNDLLTLVVKDLNGFVRRGLVSLEKFIDVV